MMCAFCGRTCDECMMDNDCGFCYVETDIDSAVNGSCVPAEHDEQGVVIFTESEYGRCQHSPLHEPLHWAYDYCPTEFAWMALLGLMLYLMCFAPGQSPLSFSVTVCWFDLLSLIAVFDFVDFVFVFFHVFL